MLKGKVSDSSGGALPGSTVIVTNNDARVVRTTTTDQTGHYVVPNLPATTYEIRAEFPGFAADVRQVQTLHVGTTVDIDFLLAPAAVVESVTVAGALPQFETSQSTLTRTVQSAEIDALPVINRNFNDLAALAPGVTKTGVYGGVDIGGNRDFQNAYQVDGVSVERQRLGDQQIALAQDWIEEFQVMTGQFNAEFGQAAGGVLNVITRSGGNRRAGRLYGFFRDGAWDAIPAFATFRPSLDEHRIGSTLGGPIVTDRLFYFGGIEHFHRRSHSIVASAFPAANGTFPSTDDQTAAIAKIDVIASDTQQIRLRYNGQRQQTSGSSIGGISTQEHGRFADLRANEFVGNWTWIVSPAAANEVRTAWSTSFPKGGCNFATQHPPGTWFELSYPGGQFGCPVNTGTIAEDQFQLIHNFSWTHSHHTFKFGTQTYWTRSFGNFRNFRDGRYSFERDLAFDPLDPSTYPFSFVVIQGPIDWNVSGWSTGVFGQDGWRLTDDLTLNVSARYDVDSTLTALNPLVRIDKGLHRIAKDLDNVAPRAGIAWTPFRDSKRTVIRGGAGLFYDQNHNNVLTTVLLNNILVDRIVNINANNPSLNPFGSDAAAAKRLLADALAKGGIPDLSTLAGAAGSTNDVDHALQIPDTKQWSGGIAHEFGRWLNASADVVYAHGSDLYVLRNVNLDPLTFQRVNPNYSVINSFGNAGRSQYRALQVQVNAVPSRRQLLKVSYTLATNRSNTSTTLSGGAATNPFDYSEDEGPTDNDVRHNLALSGLTPLPFGVDVSGLLSYRSAVPYSAVSNAPRPDGKPLAFRPEPRNARHGDSAFSLDMRIAKIVSDGPHRSANIFLEVFNITNATNYGDYIGTLTSSLFGQPTTAGPKRRAQLGFRIDF